MITSPSPTGSAVEAARAPRRLKLAHVCTVDMSLRYLLLHQLRIMRERGYEVWGVSGPGQHGQALEAEGIHFVGIEDLRRDSAGLGDIRALRVLTRLFREQSFDIVHTHTPKAGVLARLAARLSGTPIVVHTVHGLYFTDESPAWLKGLVWGMERFGASFSDHVFAQNPDDLRELQRLRIVERSRSSLLGNGIDLARFNPEQPSRAEALAVRRELGIPEHAVVVGLVARMVWSKGYGAFFAAAKRLASADRVFLCVGPLEPDKGDGVPRQVLDELVASGKVVYAGVRTDIEKLYASMDIVTLPSYFPEGIPRGLMEPAAAGKPLVTTDIKGCREVVQDGVNGFVIRPKDDEAFIRAVERLCADAPLRAAMGRASRHRAEQQFDERDVAERSLALYTALLERSKHRQDSA